MSDAPADPFAGAKARIGETVKWLAATLAALGAVATAGLSVTGLPALPPDRLPLVMLCGLIAGASILWAIGILLGLMVGDAYTLHDLADDKDRKQQIDRWSTDVLPPDVITVDEMIAKRREAVAALRAAGAGSPAYAAASAAFVGWDRETNRVLNFAQFLHLKSELDKAVPNLFLLAAAASLSLGVIGYQIGAADRATAGKSVPVVFAPGAGWSAVAAALSARCGDAPFSAEGKADAPFPSWWHLTIKGPGACADLPVALPASAMVSPARP